MKRTSKLLAALAGLGLALCIAPVTASAEIGYSEDGLWMYNIYEDGSAFSVTCQDKTVTEVEVPSEIDGHTVTMIEVDCFNGCEDLKTVKIPDTVTVIVIIPDLYHSRFRLFRCMAVRQRCDCSVDARIA